MSESRQTFANVTRATVGWTAQMCHVKVLNTAQVMVYAAAMTHVFAILYGMVQLAVWQTAPVSIPVQRRAIAFYLTLA
ncbi:hypothetical protein pdam_00018512, partial [Pocillopora damicornis]